jgi:Ankyrin repeats (3 copies)
MTNCKYLIKTMPVLAECIIAMLFCACSSPQKRAAQFARQIEFNVNPEGYGKADSIFAAAIRHDKSNDLIAFQYGDLLASNGYDVRAMQVVATCTLGRCREIYASAFKSLQNRIESMSFDSLDWPEYLNSLEKYYKVENVSAPRARALLAVIKLIYSRPEEWRLAKKAIGILDAHCAEFDSACLTLINSPEYKVQYLKGSISGAAIDKLDNNEQPISYALMLGYTINETSAPALNNRTLAYYQGMVDGAVETLKKKIYALTSLDSITAWILGRFDYGNRSLDEAKTALRKGAKINAQDIHGRTLLYWSAADKSEPFTQFLLRKGADFTLKDDEGETALSEAVLCGNTVALKALMEAGADIRQTLNDGSSLVMIAASAREVKVLELLLQKGVGPNLKNTSGQTALMLAAAQEGDWITKNIDILLKYGAVIDEIDTAGCTALMYAAGNDQQATVKYLIDKGAHQSIKNHAGETVNDILSRRKSADKN